MVNRGKFETAEKIGSRWYIDPKEPYPVHVPPAGKTSIIQYSEAHGKSHQFMSNIAKQGKFETAEKIGGRWYIAPNEPYPAKNEHEGKVTMTQYAALKGRSVKRIEQLIAQGRFKTTEHVDGRWYIDPKEPYPSAPLKNKITLTDYAELKNRKYQSALKRISQKKFKTAERRGRQWYIDPNEPYPSLAPLKSKIPLPEYAKQQNLRYWSVLAMARRGRLNSAEKIGCRWYIDPNESYPGNPVKKGHEGKITTTQYAVLHGRTCSRINQLIAQGRFKTAEQVGVRWYIDPNEPYPSPLPYKYYPKKERQIPNKITVKQAMEHYEKSQCTMYWYLRQGYFWTDEKKWGKWYIDKNEPFPEPIRKDEKIKKVLKSMSSTDSFFTLTFDKEFIDKLVSILAKEDHCSVLPIEKDWRTICFRGDNRTTELRLTLLGNLRLTISLVHITNARQGIMSKILAVLIDFCKLNKIKNLVAECVETKEMVNFCKKHGFTPDSNSTMEIDGVLIGDYILPTAKD